MEARIHGARVPGLGLAGHVQRRASGHPPENPPTGPRTSNRFWQDHYDRYDDCTCEVDDYECLLGDALYYADETESSMPGCGPIIRSAKRVVASYTGGAVWRARNPNG